jgi:uncharacterized cupredoxin-like copper-binding protein
MKYRVIYLFLFIAAMSALVYPQDTPDKIVNISAEPKSKQIKPGKEAELLIKVKIKKDWHINANKPRDKNLAATTLTIKDSPDFTVTGIIYPEPVISYLSFSENELALYEGETVIQVKIRPGKKAKDKIVINGQLQFQPCNDQTCLFPFNKAFSAEIKLN